MKAVGRTQSFIQKVSMKPKQKVDASVELELQKEHMRVQLHSQARRIVHLQGKAHIHLVVLDQYHDETQHSVTGLELDAAEQGFFMMFNRLRVLSSFKPLEGKKFTGEFNYEAYL